MGDARRKYSMDDAIALLTKLNGQYNTRAEKYALEVKTDDDAPVYFLVCFQWDRPPKYVRFLKLNELIQWLMLLTQGSKKE